ncbi:ABC transporter permease [Hymenobacter sp. ISL-91]|uniref:ABC transporter permease n=1 Tax=Hymenobacter sp. ISL-91 TaxID=2819151 RepID=UPI001BEA22D6|nr:ABC transporter permease [Hymenobacter sp. ISL-91]MBT2556301.1 ABC transporter permease [Hymenobacter sp. ISL-91]
MEYALPTAPGPFIQLGRTLVADALKMRRTAALWLALGGGALPVLLNLLIFYFKGHLLVKPGQNPWPQYVGMSWQTASVLLLPLFVVLLSGLVVNLENRGGWRQLLAQPVGRGAVFGSKLLLLLVLNAVAQALYVLLLLGAGVLLGWLKPAIGFQQHSISLLPVLRMLGHTYVATLGILGVQYALALAFRGFVGPLAAGIASIVSALTLLRWEYIDLVPYAAPTRVLRLLEGDTQLHVAAALTPVEWYSLGWFALAVLVGYLLLLRRPITD